MMMIFRLLGEAAAKAASRFRTTPAEPKANAQAADDAQAHRNLGFTFQQQGRFAEAVASYRRALDLAPNDPGTHNLMGIALRQQGRLAEAEASCRRALEGLPDSAEAHRNLGITLMEQRRFAEAEAMFRSALELKPEDVITLGVLGIALMEQGRLAEAETSCRQALEREPNDANAHNILGTVLKAQGRLTEAEASVRAALAIRPSYAKAHSLLGGTLLQLGRLAEAEASCRRALELRPGDAHAHSTLGIALMEQGRLADAEASFRRAIELEPEVAKNHSNLGVVLDQQALYVGAVEAFDRALILDPDFADARLFRGLIFLKQGKFDHWPDFEQRFNLSTGPVLRRKVPGREWNGEIIRGETLLVWGEQGLGDEIWSSGMIGELKDRVVGGRVLIECNAKLVDLFARSFGVDDGPTRVEVIAKTEPPDPRCLQGVDYQVAASSLGRYLRTGLSSFPKREQTGGAYLFAAAEREAYWQDRLGTMGSGLKVGVSWRSSNTKAERALACTRLTQWGEIFKIPDIHFVNLQYDECEAELAEAEAKFGVKIVRYPEVNMFDDLDETAALIRGLDLVISAPTTVSLLSAALGVPTWQMQYPLDWQLHGLPSWPWYPSMRNYTRKWDQPWEDILARIAGDLARRTES
jgi:Flp pilus assembly protein TadD